MKAKKVAPLRTIKKSVIVPASPRNVIARAVRVVLAREITKECLPRVNERKIDVDFEPGEIHLRLGAAEVFPDDMNKLVRAFKAQGLTVRSELVVCVLGSKVLTWPPKEPKKTKRKLRKP